MSMLRIWDNDGMRIGIWDEDAIRRHEDTTRIPWHIHARYTKRQRHDSTIDISPATETTRRGIQKMREVYG
jgi:hypothetical protein